MFCGIGGFRFGLERANQIYRKHRQAEKGNGESNSFESSSQATEQSDRSNRDKSEFEQPRNSGALQYRIVWANDNNKYACQIYRKRFGEKELVEKDIREIKTNEIPDHDILSAGFPCPTFSVAGKRKGIKEARGTLFAQIVRVASAKRPSLLLLENVKGLLSSDNGRSFAIILRSLGKLGYLLEWQVLNSKFFGVPQNRERVFIIGHLGATRVKQIFPVEQDGKTINSRFRENKKRQEVAWALRERDYKDGTNFVCTQKPQELIQVGNVDEKGHNSLWGRVYSPKGLGPNLNAEGGGLGAKTGLIIDFNQDGKAYPKTEASALRSPKASQSNCVVVADRTRTLAGKGRNLESPKEVTNALSGVQKDNLLLTNLYERKPDALGRMMPIHRNKNLNLPSGDKASIRRLTPIECERLQGFPDNWTKGLSDTQRYRCLGNAVTVNVIEYLGLKILDSFN